MIAGGGCHCGAVRFEAELPATRTRQELLAAVVRIYFDYQFSVGRIVGFMLVD